MLLKKIRTKGFLGHLANETGDFIELDFADNNLWLIQGAKGAGKPSPAIPRLITNRPRNQDR